MVGPERDLAGYQMGSVRCPSRHDAARRQRGERPPSLWRPHYIDAVFSTPIRAYALDYSWCEDLEPDQCTFRGVILGEPVTRFSLAHTGDYGSGLNDSLFPCSHSWCGVEAVLWAPVPEPSTGLLVALGLLGFGARRRRSSVRVGLRRARGRAALHAAASQCETHETHREE